MTSEYNRKRAIVQFLKNEGDFSAKEIREGLEVARYDEKVFEIGNREYAVLTEEETEEEFNRYMDSYIDECILCELPENLRYYFDSEKFKRDVDMSDGKGPSLASYDGIENAEKIGKTWFNIYRRN